MPKSSTVAFYPLGSPMTREGRRRYSARVTWGSSHGAAVLWSVERGRALADGISFPDG